MATAHGETTDTSVKYADASAQRVTGDNAIEYAYRDVGEGDVPLVLLQHFRGNLDNWYPASSTRSPRTDASSRSTTSPFSRRPNHL
jgi:hypothetical protein